MGGLSFQKIMKITEEITEFVMLNAMWFIGFILGGGVFGWAPSTVALLSVLRNKITKNEYYGVIRSFWMIYKKEFIKANKLGILCMIFLIITTINKSNFDMQPEMIFRILSNMSLIARIIVFGVILYIFPLYVHYNMDFKKYFIKSLSLLFAKPIVTLAIILWNLLVYLVITKIPGLIAIFGISIYFYGIMAINYQFYMRNEQKLRIENQK